MEPVKKTCYFCSINAKTIDYKNGELLRKFVNYQFKILPRRRTGTCSKHQRLLTSTIKHARHMAILPFVSH